MVIAAVDDGYRDRKRGQRLGSMNSSKSTANDYNSRTLGHSILQSGTQTATSFAANHHYLLKQMRQELDW